MFTTGQIVFTSLFALSFVTAMILAYKKDGKHQKHYYKNVWKVGLVIVLVIVVFTILTFWSHD